MIQNTVQGTYTPKPVTKSRVVSPRESMVVEMPEFSIRINMNTLEAFNEEKTKEEAETIETLTSFVPLSTTPMPSMNADDRLDTRNRVRSEEEVHDAHLLANRRVHTQSRWKAWTFLALLVSGMWIGFVVTNTSVEQFLSNPIEATASIFRGDLRQPTEVIAVKKVKPEVWVDRQGALGDLYFAQGIIQITSDLSSPPKQIIVSIMCQDGKTKTEYLGNFIHLDNMTEENALLFKEEQIAYQTNQELKVFKPAQILNGEFQFTYVYAPDEECKVSRVAFKLL